MQRNIVERYEVTVIILTYNSTIEKVFETIDSVLAQEKVKFQIVISDDGSRTNNFDIIKKYFEKHNFVDYKLVNNITNKGTVYNYYSGLVNSEGEYIKSISPGDMLRNATVLRSWLDYNINNNLAWSFSDILCYRMENKERHILSVKAHPNCIKIYECSSERKRRWQYVVLKDTAVGCAMLGLRSIQLRYCEEIVEKVKFAEDVIWRNMMFDGIVGGYYPSSTVLYEYGTGISTNNNSKWLKRIDDDYNAANTLIINRENTDTFQKEMIRALSIKIGKNKLKKLLVKGNLAYLIKLKFFPRKTKIL